MSTNTAIKQPQTAVIYARVSSEEQVQGYSIPAQLRACREWAEKHGYAVAKEYLEEGQSAFRNVEKREALKELLADTVSKQRVFDLIIVHKLDRLFRDAFEFSILRVILEREKVQLLCVTEPMIDSVGAENLDMHRLQVVPIAEVCARNV